MSLVAELPCSQVEGLRLDQQPNFLVGQERKTSPAPLRMSWGHRACGRGELCDLCS